MTLDPPPTTPTIAGARFFPCKQCGAKLQYEPGTKFLKCPYCTTENEIPDDGARAQELDYNAAISRLKGEAPKVDSPIVTCEHCHATLTLASNITSLDCPFCGSPIVATGARAALIQPNAILPFKIPRQQATDAYRMWIRSRWFAPSALKRQAMLDAALSGVYIPAWTYDCHATTRYTGQRGDAYYVTESYTVNGRTETRQVRKIRWTSVAGVVEDDFDDVLVTATASLPEHQLDKLQPWDLASAQPYRDDYLAGFKAECYQVDLPHGFEQAKAIMAPTIDQSIRADIGGDEQRIDAKQSAYSRITFKHLLLPVWLSAYRYQGKLFQFLVNARTGEVQGQRPWSWIKITFAVLAGLIVAGLAVYAYQSMK
jgi:predicted RNA-binding Zn-ribbon protein involved in translation (DUF1610 family)